MADIVNLNIGGYKYTARKTTLTNGENFFSGLLSDRIPSTLDKDGYHFIDRDGKYFEPLLEFLRTSQLVIPPTMDVMSVHREAEFYGISIPITTSAEDREPKLRYEGVYFSEDMTSSYVFAPDGRGVFNPFNSFSAEFSYTQESAIVYITFDRSANTKSKKTLLINGDNLIDPNNQIEGLKYIPCNDIRESAVYEGMLDLSKEGKTSNLTGIVILRNTSTVYMNLSGEFSKDSSSPISTPRNLSRMWKKGICKASKFLHLPSTLVSIPLDPLSIEVVGFGDFLALRIRRLNNLYFVFFTDVADRAQEIKEPHTGESLKKKERRRDKLSPLIRTSPAAFRRSNTEGSLRNVEKE